MTPLTPAEIAALLNPTRKRQNRSFEFTTREVDLVATLLKHDHTITHRAGDIDEQRKGLLGLADRGMIRVIPDDWGSTGRSQTFTVTWAHEQAPAAAVRHLIRYHTHGTVIRSRLEDRVVNKTLDQITTTEIVAVLAWHYRYTDVHSLEVTRTDDVVTLTEHRVHHSPVTHPFPVDAVNTSDLEPVGLDDYSDHGETLTGPALSFFVHALNRATSSRETRRGVSVNLDTLEVHPARHTPPTFTHTLPGFTQGALAYFRAPLFTNSAEFIAWAENSLLVTVRCGGFKHQLHLDPHTHVPHPFPATESTVQRHQGEHLLTALSNNPALGCPAVQEGVNLFGDQSQYVQFYGTQAATLSAARTIARTVQYLEAGLDLRGVAPFLRFGLTASQASEWMGRQVVDPDGVRTALLGWAKFHWTAGPVGVSAAPV